MQTYNKTINLDYIYSYFDGTYSSATTLKKVFKGIPSIQYLFDISTGRIFDNMSHITINNKGPYFSNFVDIKKGDYVLYSKESGTISIEKKLDGYIIEDEHNCKKPINRSLNYSQFLGDYYSLKDIEEEYKWDIESLSYSPYFCTLDIYPRIGGEKVHLLKGDFIIKMDNKKLLAIHDLRELDSCFERNY